MQLSLLIGPKAMQGSRPTLHQDNASGSQTPAQQQRSTAIENRAEGTAVQPSGACDVAPVEICEEVRQSIELARTGSCSEQALESLLQTVFGHKEFRGPQLQIVQRILGGRSTLAILPTGVGSQSLLS